MFINNDTHKLTHTTTHTHVYTHFVTTTQMDNFLPFVTTIPVFTRDLASYDEALLDGERLLLNLDNENQLVQFQQKSHDHHHGHGNHKQHGHAEEKSSLAVSAAADGSVPKFDYDSVSAATTATPAVAAASLKDALAKQEQDEREEVAVGKMTLSLSHNLDGGGYLRYGQQGTRDMLEATLALDECMLIWHLPAVPTQPLQVVLVWRGNSASLYADLSSSKGRARAKEMAETGSLKQAADPAVLHAQKQQQRRQQGGSKIKKKKDKSKGRGKAKGGADDSDEELEKGIVMEIAKSDLDASHMMQYIQVSVG